MVLWAPTVLKDAREREFPLEDTQDLAQRRRAPPVFRSLPHTINSDFYPENMLKEINN